MSGWQKLSKGSTAFDMKVVADCGGEFTLADGGATVDPTNPTEVYSLSSYPKSVTVSQDAVGPATNRKAVLLRSYKIASANARQSQRRGPIQPGCPPPPPPPPPLTPPTCPRPTWQRLSRCM